MDLTAARRPALRRSRPRLPARLLRLAGDDRLVDQVRSGSSVAFEVAFDRHHRGVLAFCRHMLGSVEEAEDAVQHTFMAAYRDLVGSDRPIQLRPWLYAIARNRCLSVLRARREHPVQELVEPATEQLAAEVQRRQDLRDLLQDLAGLPEDQRAALVLAELGDVSHDEIAHILGCAREKVKALVFQARTSLNASRAARDASCPEIREQIANLRGGSLRRNVLRRHLRECAGCREFRTQVAAQRSALAIVLPVAPSMGLKQAVLGSALSGGGAVAAGGSTLAAKAIVIAAVAGGGGAAGADAIRDRTAPAAPRPVVHEAGDRPPPSAPPVAAGDEEGAEQPAPAAAAPPDEPARAIARSRREHEKRPPAARREANAGAADPAGGNESGADTPPAHANEGGQGMPPAHANEGGQGTPPAHSNGGGDEKPKRGGGPAPSAAGSERPEHAGANGPPEHANAGGDPRGPNEQGGPPEHSLAGGQGSPPAHANPGGGSQPVPASAPGRSPAHGPPPLPDAGRRSELGTPPQPAAGGNGVGRRSPGVADAVVG